MKLVPSREDNSRTGSEKVMRHYFEPEDSYHAHKGPAHPYEPDESSPYSLPRSFKRNFTFFTFPSIDKSTKESIFFKFSSRIFP
jgi:hypothetical protein